MSAPAATSARAYLALVAAAIAFPIGYALPIYARLPSLFYDPVARHFFVGHKQGPIPMGYLGQIVYGLVCALLAGGFTWSVARKRASSDGAMTLAAAWALTGLLLVGAYFTWNNWP